jgi:hypothetical protein
MVLSKKLPVVNRLAAILNDCVKGYKNKNSENSVMFTYPSKLLSPTSHGTVLILDNNKNPKHVMTPSICGKKKM